MRFLSTDEYGVTIVELIIVTTVTVLLLGVLFGTMDNLYQSNTASLARTTQDTNTRGVLRSLESELSASTGFLSTLPTVSPYGSNNASATWSYTGNGNDRRVLIGTTYATTKQKNDETRELVFTDMGSGCNYPSATPVKNAQIYFMGPALGSDGSQPPSLSNPYNLYRRTVVNITGGSICSTPTCSASGASPACPHQKRTCAPTITAAQPANCPANDAVLLSNISKFNVDYYYSSQDPNHIANQYGTPAYPISDAKSVHITVETLGYINGTPRANVADIRISLPY